MKSTLSSSQIGSRTTLFGRSPSHFASFQTTETSEETCKLTMEPLSFRLCEPDTPTLFENSAAVVYLASELHMNPGVWGHNVQLTRNPGTNCLIVTPHWPFDLCLVVEIIEYALSMPGIVYVEVSEIICRGRKRAVTSQTLQFQQYWT